MFSGSAATGRYSSASSAKVSAFQEYSTEVESVDEEIEDSWSIPPMNSTPDIAVSFGDILGVVHGFGLRGDNLGPVPLTMAALDEGRFAALGDEEVVSPVGTKRSRPSDIVAAAGGGSAGSGPVTSGTKSTKVKGTRVALFGNTTVTTPITNAMSLVKLAETLHASKLTKFDEALVAFNTLCLTFKGDQVLSLHERIHVKAWLGSHINNASLFLSGNIEEQLYYVDENK